jgi:hypothetical protein
MNDLQRNSTPLDRKAFRVKTPADIPMNFDQSHPLLSTPVGFAEDVLGLELYPWQKNVLYDLATRGSRVTLKAANGSGKTSKIAAPLLLWHGCVFPNSQIVTTAGVWRQVKEQLWPEIRKHSSKLQGIEIFETAAHFPNGSRAIGFSTDEAEKFEGWHNPNLLIIVDEAKSVDDKIFEAIERCQPTRLLLMSSCGGSDGEFYRAFTRRRSFYSCHSVTSFDCPHLSKEWIEQQIQKWGEHHPLIRSMIFSEFTDTDRETVAIPLSSLESLFKNPPNPEPSNKIAFIDFGAGGDETVIAIRDGNIVKELIAWRDTNTMGTVNRCMNELDKYGVRADCVAVDAGGIGKPMADALAEKGWVVHPVNNQSPAMEKHTYVNRGTEMWFIAGRMIEQKEVVLPHDEILIQQLISRRICYHSSGKILVESKQEMKRRGLTSPDRADAVVGVLAFSHYLKMVQPAVSNLGIFESFNGSSYDGFYSG